jgi:hypothetical protein
MKHGSSRQKARRLQVEVAERLSVVLGLTIEAVPPTKPGKHKTGAVYTPEGDRPDLRVRRQGEAGVDVALLTDRAKNRVALVDFTGTRRPLYIECKNREAWDLKRVWDKGDDAALYPWMLQTSKGRHQHMRSGIELLVLGKNDWPSIVILPKLSWIPSLLLKSACSAPILIAQRFVAMPLWAFVGLLPGVTAVMASGVAHGKQTNT